MMSEKLRTARKQYACAYCREPIETGKSYVEIKKRQPLYQDAVDFQQIGIEYFSTRVHSKQFSDCFIANEIGEL